MGSSQSKSPSIGGGRRRSSSAVGVSPGASPRHSAAFGRLGNAYSPTAGSSPYGGRNSLRNSVSGSLVKAASWTHLSDRVLGAAARGASPSEVSPLLMKQAEKVGRMLSESGSNGGGGDGHAGDPLANSPPLVVWIGPALACALAYALYNIFIKKGSASINPILGGVILQFVAAILGCCLLAGVVYFNKNNGSGDEYDEYDDDGVLPDPDELLFWDWKGIRFAILAGISVGAAEMISFCVSGMGVQAMQSIPVIIGGSVLFGTVLGWAALGESLSIRGWSGVLLISIGISLVGLDDDGEGI